MNTILLCGTIIYIGKEFTSEKGITKRTIGICVKGEKHNSYYDIFCYGHLSEYLRQNFCKGDYIFITARLDSRSERKEDGTFAERKYYIVAENMVNLRSDNLSANEKCIKQAEEEGYLDVTSATTGVTSKILNAKKDYEDEPPF